MPVQRRLDAEHKKVGAHRLYGKIVQADWPLRLAVEESHGVGCDFDLCRFGSLEFVVVAVLGHPVVQQKFLQEMGLRKLAFFG